MLCARDEINGDLDGAMALVNDLANQGYVVVAADESTKDVLQSCVGLDVQVAKKDAIEQRAKDRMHEKISLVLDLSEKQRNEACNKNWLHCIQHCWAYFSTLSN